MVVLVMAFLGGADVIHVDLAQRMEQDSESVMDVYELVGETVHESAYCKDFYAAEVLAGVVKSRCHLAA
jgi:hypothetical protein